MSQPTTIFHEYCSICRFLDSCQVQKDDASSTLSGEGNHSARSLKCSETSSYWLPNKLRPSVSTLKESITGSCQCTAMLTQVLGHIPAWPKQDKQQGCTVLSGSFCFLQTAQRTCMFLLRLHLHLLRAENTAVAGKRRQPVRPAVVAKRTSACTMSE